MSQLAIRLSAITICATALLVVPVFTSAEAASGTLHVHVKSTGGIGVTPVGPPASRGHLLRLMPSQGRSAPASAEASNARYGRLRSPTILTGRSPSTDVARG